MKKTMFAMVLGVALLAPAIAQANPGGFICKIDPKAKGCQVTPTAMPEPGSILMLTAGLLGLAGYTLLRRKKVTQ
ncbi:MAG TPA: PEP-CTERM sorting domain-containing protein [Candidatus Acidoferrales bacterium]